MSGWMLGIIGGSGLYDIEGAEGGVWRAVETPWGSPSDEIFFCSVAGVPLAFLPRHGRRHDIWPSGINYRANIDALKRSGCTDVISLSAVGSLCDAYAPGHFVMVSQYIDRTLRTPRSFFGNGCVAHVSMADPVCSRLTARVAEAGREVGIVMHDAGVYVAVEGPQFSTRAESHLYRSWRCDVIGMTNMPEARMAREAELPYASVAMVTDYDCWRDEGQDVRVTDVFSVLQANAGRARILIGRLVRNLGLVQRTPSPDGIETVLDTALVTPVEHRDPDLVKKLSAVAGRSLSSWA